MNTELKKLTEQCNLEITKVKEKYKKMKEKVREKYKKMKEKDNKLNNKKIDIAIIIIPNISKRRSVAIFPTFENWNHNYQVYTKKFN